MLLEATAALFVLLGIAMLAGVRRSLLLKVATSVLLIDGIGLLLGAPWLLGRKPVLGAKHAEIIHFQARTLDYLGALLFAFVGAAVCAILIVRQARAEYRSAAQENLRKLLRGPTEDGDGRQNP